MVGAGGWWVRLDSGLEVELSEWPWSKMEQSEEVASIGM